MHVETKDKRFLHPDHIVEHIAPLHFIINNHLETLQTVFKYFLLYSHCLENRLATKILSCTISVTILLLFFPYLLLQQNKTIMFAWNLAQANVAKHVLSVLNQMLQILNKGIGDIKNYILVEWGIDLNLVIQVTEKEQETQEFFSNNARGRPSINMCKLSIILQC